MIQANELRIENIVAFGENTYWVEGLNGKSARVHRNGQVAGNIPYSKLNPLPLVPSILKKCGFGFDDGFWFPHFKVIKDIKSFVLGSYPKGEDNKVRWMIVDQEGVDLYFLHQLQNLYFALTGTELEIKL